MHLFIKRLIFIQIFRIFIACTVWTQFQVRYGWYFFFKLNSFPPNLILQHSWFFHPMYVQKYAFRLKQQLEKTKRRTHNKNLLSQEANSVSNYQDRIGGGRGVRYSSFWCGARPSSSRELLIKEEELEQGLYLDLHDLKATHRAWAFVLFANLLSRFFSDFRYTIIIPSKYQK